MLQVLVDADTVLEALLNRSRFVIASEKLAELLQSRQIRGYVSELGLAKIFSVVSRLRNSETAEEVVSEICRTLSLCPISPDLLQQARSLNIEDFESAVEVACAIAQKLGAIVTHKPHDFEGAADLVVLSVNDLLQRQHLQDFLEHCQVNLQQWFQGIFDTGWHEPEVFFGPALSSFRSRNLETSTVRRGKLLNFGSQASTTEAQVILLIGVEKVTELDVTISITVNTPQEERIPPGTELEILDETGKEIMRAQASRDTGSIQANCRGSIGEHFSVRVTLEDINFTEAFVI